MADYSPVLIHKITKDRRAGEYQLHIKKILGFKHWAAEAETQTVSPTIRVQRVVLTESASSEKIRSKEGPAEWPFVPTPFRQGQLLSVVGKAIGKPSPTERILVVDDEEPIREIISMLGFGGYRCRAVAGGGQALKMLDSGEKFDLVTSDLMNSPLDGIGFLEQIKSKFPEIARGALGVPRREARCLQD